MMQNREKKRQKVKEFLRELKSMVPPSQGGSSTKLGTLSTLDYVVSSMRKIAGKNDLIHVSMEAWGGGLGWGCSSVGRGVELACR